MRMKASRTVIFVVFTLLVVSIVPFLFPHARAQAVAAPGYSVDDFATGLKYGTGGYIPNVGPLGLASDPLGNLYVADIASCNVFKFNHGLGQVASDANVFVKTSTLSPLCPHGLTFGRDGNLYLNLIDLVNGPGAADGEVVQIGDRKSTRLNSSHSHISYAVFCLKTKKVNVPLTQSASHRSHQLPRILHESRQQLVEEASAHAQSPPPDCCLFQR